MSISQASERPPGGHGFGTVLVFFGLTFLLTAPIWVLSGSSGIQILPGLPLAALAVVCPVAAAVILTGRGQGLSGIRTLLARAVDARRIRPLGWWVPILLIPPAVSVCAFWIIRLSGAGIPDPQIDLAGVVALSGFFLLGALCEELGWSGFALDPLQARWGAVAAALLVGAAWALWHYPALLQAHRSWAWIGWWTLGTMALRLVMVWLYNGAGHSVFAVAVLHAVSNLCWQLFPVQGSWFDPRTHGLLMALIALAIMIGARARLGGLSARQG